MNVGIVSKASHAKSHIQALRRAGHKVTLLGGGPKVSMPSSLDVIVLRTDSCAHTAFGAVMREKRRAGGRPVIIENGVTAIVDAVEALAKKSLMSQLGLPERAKRTLKEWIHVLVDTFGVYGPKLHEARHRELMEKLATGQQQDVSKALELWDASIAACKQKSIATILGAGWKGQPDLRTVFFLNSRQGISATRFVAPQDPGLETVRLALGFFSTVEEAALQKKPASPKSSRVKRKLSRRKAARVEQAAAEASPAIAAGLPRATTALVQPPPNREEEARRVAASVLARWETAREIRAEAKALQATPPVEVVASPVKVVAPPADPEAELKTLLSMLLREIRLLDIPEISLTAEGAASYERRVVVKRALSITE